MSQWGMPTIILQIVRSIEIWSAINVNLFT